MKGADKRFLITALALCFILGLVGFIARHAGTANADACQLSPDQFLADLENGQVMVGSIISATSSASVMITNNTDCSAPVSLSAYAMFVAPHAPQWLSTQQIIGLTSTSLAPSSTMTLDVPIDPCMTQVDAWYGTAPNTLLDTNPYQYPPNVPYVLKPLFIGNQLCITSTSTTPTSTCTSNCDGNGGGGGGGTSDGGGGGGGGGGNVATAEIAITKTVDNANPNPGSTIHYTATIQALGPSTSIDVIATDKLPGGVTFVSAITSVGIYSSSTGLWLLGNVNRGVDPTLVITATVNSNDPAGEVITNNAMVSESSIANDPFTGNNFASVAITVGGASGGGTSGGGVGVANVIGNVVPVLPNTGPAPVPSPSTTVAAAVPRFPDTGFLPDGN